MCGGIYEEDFENNDSEGTVETSKKSESTNVERDLKFTTAGEYMEQVYPGKCCQE